MFDDICFDKTFVNFTFRTSFDNKTLSYKIDSKNPNESTNHLSQYLPIHCLDSLTMLSELSPMVQWSKDVLSTLGYVEESNNSFILELKPKLVDFSHAVIYLPSDYKSGNIRFLYFHEFGNKTDFNLKISKYLPIFKDSDTRLTIQSNDKLKYNKAEVLEFLVELLKPNILKIEKNIQFMVGIYQRQKFDAYYITNIDKIKLVKFDGTEMEQRVVFEFSRRREFVDFKFHHNINSSFIKELKAAVRESNELSFSETFGNRILIDPSVDTSKLISSLKLLGNKHKVLINCVELQIGSDSIIQVEI
jgi:hypothetical protein